MYQFTFTARFDEGDFYSDINGVIYANNKSEAKMVVSDMYKYADIIIIINLY